MSLSNQPPTLDMYIIPPLRQSVMKPKNTWEWWSLVSQSLQFNNIQSIQVTGLDMVQLLFLLIIVHKLYITVVCSHFTYCSQLWQPQYLPMCTLVSYTFCTYIATYPVQLPVPLPSYLYTDMVFSIFCVYIQLPSPYTYSPVLQTPVCAQSSMPTYVVPTYSPVYA